MKPDVKKIQKITEANGYDMFGEWTKTDWYTWLWNIKRLGKDAKDEPQKDLQSVRGTGTCHKAYNTAS